MSQTVMDNQSRELAQNCDQRSGLITSNQTWLSCTIAPNGQRLDSKIVVGRHVGSEQLSSSHVVSVSSE